MVTITPTAVGFLLLILILAYLYFFYLLVPIFHGAPFVKTKKNNILALIDYLKSNFGYQKVFKAIDLGCGTGDLMITFAHNNIACDGVELNKILYLRARYKVTKAGLNAHTNLINKNFFEVNLSKYNLVILFQTPYIMTKLYKKLKSELQPGSVVASYCFKFPNVTANTAIGSWYIYEI